MGWIGTDCWIDSTRSDEWNQRIAIEIARSRSFREVSKCGENVKQGTKRRVLHATPRHSTAHSCRLTLSSIVNGGSLCTHHDATASVGCARWWNHDHRHSGAALVHTHLLNNSVLQVHFTVVYVASAHRRILHQDQISSATSCKHSSADLR